MAYSTTSIYFILHITISTTLFVHSNGANLPKFPALFLFGDSILDTGMNNYIKTILKANHAPYGVNFPGHVPTGRWSDGKLISDLLAEALGIKELMPPYLQPNLSANELKTGVCFASAGAGWDERTNAMSNVIPLSRQLRMFQKQYTRKLVSAVGRHQAKHIIQNCLVFVLSGSNDYFTHGLESPVYVHALHNKIKAFIQGLYKIGVRNMMVAGIPPFAKTSNYNPKLKKLLSQLQVSLPGSRIVYADIATPLTAVNVNPTKYGLVVASTPCCGEGCASATSPLCKNPQQHYSFDGIHPTEAVYKIISKFLIDNTLPQFAKKNSSNS